MIAALAIAALVAVPVFRMLAAEQAARALTIERTRVVVRQDLTDPQIVAIIAVRPVQRERPIPKDRPLVPTSPKEGTREPR